ncbi:microsomal glutathione S-transferase 1 isoform X2 [Aethina tumida]|uniref:microsomal glutathione S-transferase 1 isoform X2 n=1 Tax=Aethina tumida TaxID=116153 RepID=UPI00096B039C|nr:microsomal glutathione S-transferase 1 isoform X2 [Aethina tumida]
MSAVLSLENPLLKTYFYYVSVLGLKMLLMSAMTGFQRFKTKSFANPEDAEPMKLKVRVNDAVERVRRAHLNDLENITVFFIISFAYIMTDPSVFITTMLFRVYTIARFIHTFVYAIVVCPQPSRALSWGVGYGITIYMGIATVLSLCKHM